MHGLRRALDAPGEWHYDSKNKKLLLIPPKDTDIKNINIEAKKRDVVIDLSNVSYVHISGIKFRSGGIRMNDKTSHIVLKELKGTYVAHNLVHDVSNKSGVQIKGNNNLVLSCELGYSSAAVLSAKGTDNRIINNYIHHGGYGALWKGTVALAGRRILFSHNTVKHAGRDLINTHGLMESTLQYNDVSDAGWLTTDLGMFYGHNTDFANTEFKYNLVHDNHAKHCSMGIYFDHLSHNAIVHHNVIWNVGMDPIRFNNPSYCNLVFNNTCWKSGNIDTFDHTKRNDLFASRYVNNIFNRKVNLPKHVVKTGNLLSNNPPYRDTAKGDFRLKAGTDSKAGAYPANGKLFKAGCDLKNPPSPLPVYKAPRIPWMNMVKNACFEFGTFEGWTASGTSQPKITAGNSWGNTIAGEVRENHATGTSKYEAQIGSGISAVSQIIKGLTPNTKYTVSAWMRVEKEGDKIALTVSGHGKGTQPATTDSKVWIRKFIEFTTGPNSRQATITIKTPATTKGHAWCDNVVLPLTAPSEK